MNINFILFNDKLFLVKHSKHSTKICEKKKLFHYRTAKLKDNLNVEWIIIIIKCKTYVS